MISKGAFQPWWFCDSAKREPCRDPGAGNPTCLDWISQDSTLQSMFFLFIFPFPLCIIFWSLRASLMLFSVLLSDCFVKKKTEQTKNQPNNNSKKIEFIVTYLNVQTLILVRPAYTVGGIQLPKCKAPLCCRRYPRATHLSLHLHRRAWGPFSFVSLMETFSHSLSLLECHWTPMFMQLNLDHSEALHSVQRLRESFLRIFFDRKLGIYLFFCVVCAFPVGRIPDESLVVQLTACTYAARGELKHFSTSFVEAAAYTSDSCALLYIIAT